MMEKRVTYSAIAFDLGKSLQTDISNRALKFYDYVAKQFDNEATVGHSPPKTIPIPWSVVASSRNTQNIGELGEVASLVSQSDILIIDLTYCQNDAILLQGVRSLKASLDVLVESVLENQQDADPLIILISREPLDFSLQHQNFYSKFRAGEIVNIDTYGEIMGAKTISIRGKKISIATVKENITVPEFVSTWLPMDELAKRVQAKLVKYPGIYELTQHDGSTSRKTYYYDAGPAWEDVMRYVSLHLANSINSGGVDVYCCSDNSPVFGEDFCSLLARDINRIYGPEAKVNIQRIQEIWKISEGEIPEGKNKKALIFVPFVASGKSVGRFIEELSKSCNYEEISILAVVQNIGFVKSQLDSAKDLNLIYEFISQTDGDNELSDFGIVLSALGYSADLGKIMSERNTIPSDLFWLMSFECGVRREKHAPKHRRSISYVVNYVKMIEKFSSYLIHTLGFKINKLAEAPVLICVDEKNDAEPDTDASKAICDSFKAMRGDDYVTIPREALDKLEDITDVDGLKQLYPHEDWMSDLIRIAETPGVAAIIFDEFRYTGGTTEKLKKILNLFEITVASSIVLVDFNPSSRSHEDHALYNLSTAKA